MLDTLDLSLRCDQQTYADRTKILMQKLRSLQQACYERQQPLIIILEGWAAAGKGSLLKKMTRYMDPRGFTVYPTFPATAEEQKYPFLWRFSKNLPAHGSIAVFYHSWYIRLLEDRLFDRIDSANLPAAIQDINAFERQLVDDGVAIAKFWIHLSRRELQRRLAKYAKDQLSAWRVRSEDWQQAKQYHRYKAMAEEMLIHTSTGHAPWILVEGDHSRWAKLKVLGQLVAIMTESLDKQAIAITPPSLPPQTQLDPAEPDLLGAVDLTRQLSRHDYKAQLRQKQVKLRRLQLTIHQENLPVLILFEGWDAAGKGGAIKRLTDILDPRSYQVHPFGAPTQEEKRHHYLWRFWQKLPRAGMIGIFDRTWYGRVLVERVEGFASEPEWRRAYREINEFELQLTNTGYILIKFWLHISPQEQLDRFHKRQQDPFRQYKLTDEDWRNREKWPLYEVAVNQAIQRTHTPNAPWTIIPANDKYYARVMVIQTVIQAIQQHQKRLK